MGNAGSVAFALTEVTINAMSEMNLASMFFRAGEGRGPRAAASVYSANILPDSIEFTEFCVTAGKRRHLPKLGPKRCNKNDRLLSIPEITAKLTTAKTQLEGLLKRG
jgi:hypothetical protein